MEGFTKRLLQQLIPRSWQPTLFLRLFGLRNVLMIWWVQARVVSYAAHEVKVLIPLTRRTRNHLKSMYFGALAVGADCAGGLVAVAKIYDRALPIDFVFKDFEANFFKRPDGDVVFTCTDGLALEEAIVRAEQSKERVNVPIHITATVPDRYGEEVLASFKLTLSLKWRS